MFCKALQRYDEPYTDSRNHYNDSLEYVDLSENSQIVADILQIVLRLTESYNDSRIVITIPKNVVFNLGH
jgi:hypothetical protein